MKVINVRLSGKVVSDIDKLAKRHALSRSEVIRQALVVYLHLVEGVGTLIRPIAFQVKPAQITYTRKGDVSILGKICCRRCKGNDSGRNSSQNRKHGYELALTKNFCSNISSSNYHSMNSWVVSKGCYRNSDDPPYVLILS